MEMKILVCRSVFTKPSHMHSSLNAPPIAEAVKEIKEEIITKHILLVFYLYCSCNSVRMSHWTKRLLTYFYQLQLNISSPPFFEFGFKLVPGYVMKLWRSIISLESIKSFYGWEPLIRLSHIPYRLGRGHPSPLLYRRLQSRNSNLGVSITCDHDVCTREWVVIKTKQPKSANAVRWMSTPLLCGRSRGIAYRLPYKFHTTSYNWIK